MPLQALQFRPGINRDTTSLDSEGGWFECDKVRFRSGKPEKIGGWTLEGGTYHTVATVSPPGILEPLWPPEELPE